MVCGNYNSQNLASFPSLLQFSHKYKLFRTCLKSKNSFLQIFKALPLCIFLLSSILPCNIYVCPMGFVFHLKKSNHLVFFHLLIFSYSIEICLDRNMGNFSAQSCNCFHSLCSHSPLSCVQHLPNHSFIDVIYFCCSNMFLNLLPFITNWHEIKIQIF